MAQLLVAGTGIRRIDDVDGYDRKPCVDGSGPGTCNSRKAFVTFVFRYVPGLGPVPAFYHHNNVCSHITRPGKAEILFDLPSTGDYFRKRLKGLVPMSGTNAAKLLLDYLDLLTGLDRSLPVLDLACGTGRNGLLLAEQGIPVLFADKSTGLLEVVEQRLAQSGLQGRCWLVDLEQAGAQPLSGLRFAAVIDFRYLHRPLFPALRESVTPGGLVVYETFTLEQCRFGRPKNPDFLLRPGELTTHFKDWEIIFEFEGVRQNPDRAVAQIVARKPLIRDQR